MRSTPNLPRANYRRIYLTLINALTIMNVQTTIARIKAILLNPKTEWNVIKEEEKSNKELLLYFALPLAVLGGVASLIQYLGSAVGIGYGLRLVIVQIALPLVAIVIAAYVINELADKFKSEKDLNNAFKLVTYSYTPALVAAVIANLSWTLGWVGLFGLYGIYLFWIGLPKLMNTPEEKKGTYVLAAALIIVVINIVIATIFSLGGAGYYSPY